MLLVQTWPSMEWVTQVQQWSYLTAVLILRQTLQASSSFSAVVHCVMH